MHHFFVSPEQIGEYSVRIVGQDVNHIRQVLRMHTGDELVVRTGQDMKEYRCAIAQMDEQCIEAQILWTVELDTELPCRITLFQCLPKSDKMEWILQKGTELGISSFVPVDMQRCVVRYDAKKEIKKTERFRKIVESAAKQSGRGRIPEVKEPQSFLKTVEDVKNYDLFLVPYEAGLDYSLKKTLNALPHMPKTIAILIGPEGGIDPGEVEALTGAGAKIVGLGPRILRTETAGMAAATMLLYHFDQMEL